MHANDALKQAAAAAGVPITHIGPALGKAPNYVNNSSSRGSTPRCDTMAAMLSVCGYALCAIPREDIPESAIELDGTKKELGEDVLRAAKEAFRRCDPLGLIAGGCPDDEYDAEAKALASVIDDPSDTACVAASAKGILAEAFGEPLGDEECGRIAEEIGRILAKAGQGA